MILNLGGHIGANASALVDGQLSKDEEERAWQHVVTCPGCRRLVEREGWIKRRLSLLSSDPLPQSAAPAELVDNLCALDAWAMVGEIERRSVRRRAVLAVAGAGSVGAAVFSIVALTAPPVGHGEAPAPATIRADLIGRAVTTGIATGFTGRAPTRPVGAP